MGTLTGQSFIDRVAGDLNDDDHIYWSEAELLTYLSDGQRAAVLVLPEVNPVTESLRLAAGTKQAIPADAFQLIDVVRNLPNGTAITPTAKSDIDQSNPNWHSQAQSSETDNFIYDVRNRRTFFVTPPATANHSIEIVISKIPPEISSAATAIEIDDIYQPALLAYMFHRAFMKDVASEGQSVQKAQGYFELFMTLLLGRADEDDLDVQVRQEVGEIGNRASVRGRGRR